MIDSVYGDPKEDHVAQQVRAHLPRFGAVEGQPGATVTPLRSRRR